MNQWLYTLRGRFTPETPGWNSYLKFSGFHHITEMVTLDSILCPDLIGALVAEDWSYNVHEDNKTSLFRDPEYLLRRAPIEPARRQVLAILERPDGSEMVPSGVERCGYDIMDSYFGNSTLTNCGRMPEVFDPAIVNQWGLLFEFGMAIAIRDRMRRLQPDDPHLGACDVWFVGRTLPGS